MSLRVHVDVVRDTSKVIGNVAVCVIRHNVQKSLRILNILLPGWLWVVTSYCLRCNDVVEALIFHQHMLLTISTFAPSMSETVMPV